MAIIKTCLIYGGKFQHKEGAGIIKRLLEGRELANVTVTTDLKTLTAARITKYDLVILYTQGGELTEAQERGLIGFVRSGGALIGVHSAAASFKQNPNYLKLVGCQFTGHGPICEFPVRIDNKNHYITTRMDDFTVTDELYTLKMLDPRAKVLASAFWQGKSEPIVYVKKAGRGRICFITLGHEPQVIARTEFQRLLCRGINYVTGQTRERTLTCGILGYGPAFGMGRQHAELINTTGVLKSTAVCDIAPECLDRAKKELGNIQTFSRLEDMLDKSGVEMVVVILPHHLHAPTAIQCLQAGKHVVLEKPMCLTADEATEMIEVAQEKNVCLTVFHNRRHDGDFKAFKEVIDGGLIGKVFHIEAFMGGYSRPRTWWRSDKGVSGGSHYDWGAHFIDWILNLVPEKIVGVGGVIQNRVWHQVTNEDHVQIMLCFADGCTADFQTSSIAAAEKPRWRILGDKGAILDDGSHENAFELTIIRNEQKVRTIMPYMPAAWNRYYMELADHLVAGDPLDVTAHQARRVIAVLETAQQAAADGQFCRVPGE